MGESAVNGVYGSAHVHTHAHARARAHTHTQPPSGTDGDSERRPPTEGRFACKRCAGTALTNKDRDDFVAEIAISVGMDHKNVLHVVGIVRRPTALRTCQGHAVFGSYVGLGHSHLAPVLPIGAVVVVAVVVALAFVLKLALARVLALALALVFVLSLVLVLVVVADAAVVCLLRKYYCCCCCRCPLHATLTLIHLRVHYRGRLFVDACASR